MPWWGWLLLGGAGTGVLVLVAYLLLRRKATPTGSDADRTALAESARKRVEEDLAAERELRRKAERAAVALEVELRGIATERKRKLEVLDAEKRKEYAALAGDPDALLARVDALLRDADDPAGR